MKDKILDYITNNVNTTSGLNEPIFTNNKNININLQSVILTKLSTLESAVSINIIDCITDNDSQNIVFYGTYLDNNSNTYGFVYLTDKDLNELQMITTFSTGTKLFPIRCLNQDENGLFYGLSYDSIFDINVRVLLLNNIFVKIGQNYQVILRQSYLVDNAQYYSFDNTFTTFQHQVKKTIMKVPEEATYFILCQDSNNETYVIRFTINVGSTNDWVYTAIGIAGNVFDALIEKTESSTKYYYFCQGINNYTEYLVENDVLSTITNYNVGYVLSSICALSTSAKYGIGTKNSNLEIIKIDPSPTVIYTTANVTNTHISMNIIKNIPCVEINTFVNSSPNDITIGIINNNSIFLSDTMTWTGGAIFFPVMSYNLLNIYVNTNNVITKFNIDYNPLNYNGLEYVSYNQTVPSKGRLYANNELVFARNLYNTTLLNSTTTSTLQIPNTLLNNINITKEDLIGETGSILITSNTNFSKNIYETLFINFINNIGVIDEDTNTTYPLAANYINQNINIGTQQNCEDSFVGKVQIVYSNQTLTQNLIWTYVTDHYETTFTIDAVEEVPQLTFMSNDLSVIYLNKTLDVAIGDFYIINQKLRIE